MTGNSEAQNVADVVGMAPVHSHLRNSGCMEVAESQAEGSRIDTMDDLTCW